LKPRVGVVQFSATCVEGNEQPLARGVTFEIARRLTSVGVEANAILITKGDRSVSSSVGEMDVPTFPDGASDFSVPGFGAHYESDFIVLGRFQVADGLLFFYRIYEVESGRLIRDGCVSGLRSAVFRLLDDVAGIVRECIGREAEDDGEPEYNPVFDDVAFDAFVEHCLARGEDRASNVQDHLERAMELEPRFRIALVDYLSMCYEVDDLCNSLRFLDSYLAEEPGDHELLIGAANLCLAFHRLDEGLGYARRCLESRPLDVEPHVLMARFLFAREQVKEAGVHLDAALRSHDDTPEGRYALGRYFLDLGDFYRARDFFEQCLEADGGYIVALRDLQCCYYELGDFPDAIRACEGLLEADPADAGSYYNLGLVYQRLGRAHLAAKYFEESVRQDAGFFKAIYMLGEYHFAHDRARDALARFEEAHRVAPSSAEALGRIGDCHHLLGRSSEAFRYYVWASREDPVYENARYQVLQGAALVEEGKLEEAHALLLKATELDDALPDAWNELAWALLQRGKSEEALNVIRRAVELEPDDPSLLSNLLSAASRLPLGVRLSGWARELVRSTRRRLRELQDLGEVPLEATRRRVRRFPGTLTWYALRG
jgi:tetratricopeptide (TPR) repeat protein